jgi:hypothetical protein
MAIEQEAAIAFPISVDGASEHQTIGLLYQTLCYRRPVYGTLIPCD